jgi:LysM repeat protein
VNSLERNLTLFILAAVLFSGTLAADELMHAVGKGETIYSISRFYRITPEELMKANGISDPSKLQVGKKLIIPSSAFSDITVSSAPATVTENSSQAQAVSQNLTNYRVVKGDTLYSIARTSGISLQALLEINKFSSNHVIKAGDTIKVPGNSANTAKANTVNTNTVNTNTVNTAPAKSAPPSNTGAAVPPKSGVFSMRWPVIPKDIAYMTGQMGVVVHGEHNEPVKSLTKGKVISAGPWRKFGKVAIVEVAGGYFYMYGGCESLSVKVGDKISPGTELGKLGINAVSEKAQLFFMVFRSDTPIDPAKAPRA